MVKRLILLLSTLLLLGLGTLTAAGLWVLRTPQGARWLLETGARAGGAQLAIDRVEGRLIDDLRLWRVRVRRRETGATFDRLRLRWRPGRLLRGELAVAELALEGGDITTGPASPAGEAKPAEFAWPRLSGWALKIDGAIEKLRLKEIAIHSAGGEVRKLDDLTARLGWDEGVLEVSGLDAASEGFRLRGDASAGFVRPLLRLELGLDLPEAAADLDRLQLTAKLAEGDDALLSGPVVLQGAKAAERLFDFNSQIALGRDLMRLSSFELTRSSWDGVLRGEGEVALKAPFAFSLRVEAEGIDLRKPAGVAAELGGKLEVAGTVEDYGGRFDLACRGAAWRRGRLSGRFTGNLQEVVLRDLNGSWLGGSMGGEATVGWRDGIYVEAMLAGRGLDPAVLAPQWSGEVNLDVAASVAKPPDEAVRVDLKGELLDSTLRGRPLTGRADLTLRGEELRIAALELRGDGFELSAHGPLRERLEVVADVRWLGGLVPAAAGSLQARGWLRWREGEAAGSLRVQGEKLAFAGVRAATLRGDLNRPQGQPFTVRIHAGGVAYDRLRLETLELALDGTPARHELKVKAGGPQGRGELIAEGGWRGEYWSGSLEQLHGETRQFGAWRLSDPVAVQAGARRLTVETMRLKGDGEMALDLAADLSGSPLRGTLEGTWREIDLVLLRPWLPETMELAGRSSGKADLDLQDGGGTVVAGRVEAAGRLALGDFSAAFSRVEGSVDWNAGGLAGRLEAELEEGGRLTADLKSDGPPPAIPQGGTLAANWEGIDLDLLRPWLPGSLRLRGKLGGQAQGEWLQGGKLSLAGSAEVSDGEAAWRREEGEVAFALQRASAGWRWRGESLEGELDLTLAEVGRIEGSFTLPLPARIPTAPVPQGPLSLHLSGEMREQGLLSAVFPGLLRESEGQLAAQLSVGGTWRSPEMGGRLSLTGAGAYLPAAGIEIEDVEARAELSGQSLRLVSFSARSGPGRIEGEGEVRLDQWRVAEYRATVKGERFRAVNLPELQLLVSPDLTLGGTTGRLKVRGAVEVPELVLIERKRPEMVSESPDVMIVGEEASAEKGGLPIALDLRVKVTLGDRVLIKLAGVDARLAGGLDLVAEGVEEITANGEIRVVEGIYSTHGVQLKIVRGRLLYAGGPVDRPTLDILALRTIGEVKAGVRVGGTPRQPVVNLTSEPAMPDTDVLSYIVLGHPAGGDRQSAGLLMSAAGALLSRGESAVLQDRLKRGLGVDVLTVESGGSDVASSMVTIGKYLTPRLYISYGQSLFTESTVATLRYKLGEHWDLESKMGEESGVDLFYKIEFK